MIHMLANMKRRIMNAKSFTTILVILNTSITNSNHEKIPGIIYILLWSALNDAPFKYWSYENKSFVSNNCSFQNCFLVHRRKYFEDIKDYDSILFNLIKLGDDLPLERADNQIYVFVAIESPSYWPLSEQYNWYFNYTWTYRLDSDLVYSYFRVTDRHGVVGPKINVHFRNITRMRPTKKSIIEKLKHKHIAAAWIVSNRFSTNDRLNYGHSVNSALKKYNLSLDIYGNCGDKFCSIDDCEKMIENTYYFYFAFENSNCEDYVTEKLMRALTNYAVPVVYGGANYSYFMPDGIYLNGNVLSAEKLAEKINEAIGDKQKYYDFFRWHRYYTYHHVEGGPKDPLCSFCAFLNDQTIRNQRRVYARLNKWWNEYRSHSNEEFIERYEDSGQYVKGFLTYRDKKDQSQPEESTSAVQNVNSFFTDIFNYIFGSERSEE